MCRGIKQIYSSAEQFDKTKVYRKPLSLVKAESKQNTSTVSRQAPSGARVELTGFASLER
jgi:hypothetical protein